MNNTLPPFKWNALPWYVPHIKNGNFNLSHDKKRNLVAIEVNKTIVSNWMAKDKIKDYLYMNYYVNIDL